MESNLLGSYLAEVESIGPNMEEPVEGDKNQEDDQDGHNDLIMIGVNLAARVREVGVD